MTITELAERARAAAAACPSAGISSLDPAAVARFVADLEAKYNGGLPFALGQKAARQPFVALVFPGRPLCRPEGNR